MADSSLLLQAEDQHWLLAWCVWLWGLTLSPNFGFQIWSTALCIFTVCIIRWQEQNLQKVTTLFFLSFFLSFLAEVGYSLMFLIKCRLLLLCLTKEGWWKQEKTQKGESLPFSVCLFFSFPLHEKTSIFLRVGVGGCEPAAVLWKSVTGQKRGQRAPAV